MPDAPVVLRHKDASRQALLYGTFAAIAAAAIVGTFAVGAPAKWWSLLMLPIALIAGYSAVRLATLQVRLDERGVWEPDPFRLTYVTPWADVRKAERSTSLGRIAFVGVSIVHADGEKHEIEALKVQSGAAYAEPMVEEWIAAIHAAKDRYRS